MPTGFIASHKNRSSFPEAVLEAFEKSCAITAETSSPFLDNDWSCELTLNGTYTTDMISLKPYAGYPGTYCGHGGPEVDGRPAYSTALAKVNKEGAIALLRVYFLLFTLM